MTGIPNILETTLHRLCIGGANPDADARLNNANKCKYTASRFAYNQSSLLFLILKINGFFLPLKTERTQAFYFTIECICGRMIISIHWK